MGQIRRSDLAHRDADSIADSREQPRAGALDFHVVPDFGLGFNALRPRSVS